MDYTNLKKLSSTVLLPVETTKLSPKKQCNLYVLNDKDSEEIKNICIKNLPRWDTLNHEDIEVKLILPVLTNQVFKVNLKNKNNLLYPFSTVFVKRTTTFNSLVYDHELQYEVSKLLGDNNCGPKVLGKFGDYTIQECIQGWPLSRTSIPYSPIVSCLASSLAKFHKKGTELAPKEWDRTPFVLRQLNKWSEHVDGIIKKYNLDMDYNELENYLELYKKVMNDHLKNSNSVANSVMFCHNDLYFTNVLEVQYGLYLLDFDYAGFNYVGWEVANFFHKTDNEYDETEKLFKIVDEFEISDQMKSVFVSVYLSQLLDKNVLPSDQMVKEFRDSAELHMLGVNLFWTLWGIIMTDKPVSELGQLLEFYEYSKFHYEDFKKQLKKLTDEGKLKF